MKTKRIRTLTKSLEQDLSQKSLRCEDLSKSEEFGSGQRDFYREREGKMKSELCLAFK